MLRLHCLNQKGKQRTCGLYPNTYPCLKARRDGALGLKMERYRPPIAQLEHRIACLRRRYGQGLARRPTADELAAMRRAASLTVIADHAITNSAATADDVVRLTNAAARARSAMEALLEAGSAPAHKSYDTELRVMVET